MTFARVTCDLHLRWWVFNREGNISHDFITSVFAYCFDGETHTRTLKENTSSPAQVYFSCETAR